MRSSKMWHFLKKFLSLGLFKPNQTLFLNSRQSPLASTTPPHKGFCYVSALSPPAFTTVALNHPRQAKKIALLTDF